MRLVGVLVALRGSECASVWLHAYSQRIWKQQQQRLDQTSLVIVMLRIQVLLLFVALAESQHSLHDDPFVEAKTEHLLLTHHDRFATWA